MELLDSKNDVKELVNKLNFKDKVERSLKLIDEAYKKYGDSLVVANSLGKDSCAVWDLAKKISPNIRGFIITTRYKPGVTKKFMKDVVIRYPELKIYECKEKIEDNLYKTDPDKCCEILKVKPTRQAITEMKAKCWVTGLRCTEGRTRTDYEEIEERDVGLLKLNPILIWKEREVWQYLALNKVDVNSFYAEGFRSLGCLPCTKITTAEDERAGRWAETSKCGGECGIHTRPIK